MAITTAPPTTPSPPSLPGLPGGPPGGGPGGRTDQQNACLATTGNIFCFQPNKTGGSSGDQTGLTMSSPGLIVVNPDGSVSLGDPFSWTSIGSAAAAAAAKAGNPIATAAASILGLSLLRILFFILGIICIIGAIYLYKDTRYLVERPVRAAHAAVKTAATAAAAA